MVIPTYNSSEFIVETLESVDAGLVGDYEVLVVDDGSTDSTWEHVNDFCGKRSKFSAIRLQKNIGQSAATLVGVMESKSRVVCTMDDDGQHDPLDLLKLVSYVSKGESQFVYGHPSKKNQSRYRNLLGRFFRTTVSRLSSNQNWRNQSSMRCFRADGFRDSLLREQQPVSLDLILNTVLGTADVISVRNLKSKNPKGSRYGIRKLLSHAKLQLIGSSNALLGISGLFSVIFGVFSLLLGAYVLLSFFLRDGSSVPGFTFTSLLLSTSFSIQFFVLFVLGSYMGEVHKKSLGLPFYSVRETSNR